MQVVIFSSPSRLDMLNALKDELKNYPIKVISEPETFGKENFWKRWEQARLFCLQSKYDNFLILPDDVINLDMERIKQIHKDNEGKLFTCNVINDGRKECWGGAYFDCGGLTNRATLLKVKVTQPTNHFFKTRQSSGVGYQLTMQLRNIKAQMYTPKETLCNHGNHDSVMHPLERKRKPLIAERKLKIIVGITTFKGREKSLQKAIKSLQYQCDEIIIYDNEVNPNLTDNGKFYGLTTQDKPCYYFTCDDDLEYPSNYISTMIDAIEKYKTIVTHHGRELIGLNRSYYRGHKNFRCLDENNTIKQIDVCGTGVTGFRTDYFNPVSLYKSKDKRMSDLVFSLEAKKQGKKITILAHRKGWIKQLPVDNSTSIHATEVNNEERQIEIANEIWNLK